MNKTLSLLLFICLSTFLFVGCSNDSNRKKNTSSEQSINLTISAAASMQDTLVKIQKMYQEEQPDITISFNFGASGALQQQISQGAPVDLFLSAAIDKLDNLVEEGIIDESDHVDLLKNNLVLITNKEVGSSIKSFSDLKSLGNTKIAIGIPESVPAGKYAKEALESLNLWKQVEDHVVYAKDVRQVLSYVETNNVEAGIVYGTDALTSDKVQVVASADENSHTPIIYPIGIIKDSAKYEEAKAFYQYLQTPSILKVFEEDGFIVN